MENQNNRQGNHNRENNNDNGIMDKIGQAIENVVDAVTPDDRNNGQNRSRRNNQ